MVSFKMILLLHCIGLEQLFSNAIVGAYDFTTCNHSTIKDGYRFMLKDTVDCCQSESGKKFLGTMLGCIHYFTETYIAPQKQNIWNYTVTILKNNCQGYSQENGMQNVTATFRDSDKCDIQEQNRDQVNHALMELNEMWKRYRLLRRR